MASAYEILNRTRNKIDSAQTGWEAYVKALIPAYDAAYDLHSGALTAAGTAAKLQAEELWKVLGLVMTVFGAPWLPKLLGPAKEFGAEMDGLVSNWVKDTVVAAGSEAKSAMKGTLVEQLKNIAVGQTNDPYKPVVEKTLIYASRLEEGIKKRAYWLKKMMDDCIDHADQWTPTAASQFEKATLNFNPFVVDMPTDIGDDFKKNFQAEAEISMWVAWGLARDEKWWIKEQDSWKSGQEERKNFWPILQRLLTLGVPMSEISSWGIGYLDNRQLLDMVKFIAWAKKPKPKKSRGEAAPLACKAFDPGPFVLKRYENVCRVGE